MTPQDDTATADTAQNQAVDPSDPSAQQDASGSSGDSSNQQSGSASSSSTASTDSPEQPQGDGGQSESSPPAPPAVTHRARRGPRVVPRAGHRVFYHQKKGAPEQAADIAAITSNDAEDESVRVNLSVLAHDGRPYHRRDVRVLQPGEPAPDEGEFCSHYPVEEVSSEDESSED